MIERNILCESLSNLERRLLAKEKVKKKPKIGVDSNKLLHHKLEVKRFFHVNKKIVQGFLRYSKDLQAANCKGLSFFQESVVPHGEPMQTWLGLTKQKSTNQLKRNFWPMGLSLQG